MSRTILGNRVPYITTAVIHTPQSRTGYAYEWSAVLSTPWSPRYTADLDETLDNEDPSRQGMVWAPNHYAGYAHTQEAAEAAAQDFGQKLANSLPPFVMAHPTRQLGTLSGWLAVSSIAALGVAALCLALAVSLGGA